MICAIIPISPKYYQHISAELLTIGVMHRIYLYCGYLRIKWELMAVYIAGVPFKASIDHTVKCFHSIRADRVFSDMAIVKPFRPELSEAPQ